MATNETILLQVDVAYNDARLIDLQKQLNENKKATADLNKAFKDGKIDQDEYAKMQVRLAGDARTLRGEQTLLNKINENYIKGNEAAAGSITELRQRLASLTQQYNNLSKEERDNTAAGQALQAQTKAVSDELKNLETAIGDNRRQVGSYSEAFKGALAPAIQELVKLQEQQKLVGEGSEEYKKVTQQIGFVTKAAQDAGAKAGLSYEQTQAKLKEYGDAIRPVVAEVVKLEKEQENLEESGEAYTQVGFKIAGLKKKVEEVPVETKKLSTSLKEAAGSSDTLSSATTRYAAAKDKFTQATNLAKLAIGGEVTALGVLRLALIATGLGALVVILGSVVTFLTKTAEGTRLVESVMTQLGAAVNVVIDRLGTVGKAVVQVLSGDFTAAAQTAKGALSGIGDEISREVKLAKDLTAETQRIEAAERALSVERAKSKATVESLKFIAEDTTKTTKERIDATRQAFAIEQEQERKAIALQQQRIRLIEQEQAARNGNVGKEERQKLAEEEIKLAEIQESARTRQIELNNALNSIAGEAMAKTLANQKATADAAQKRREDAAKAMQQQIELELLAITKGTQEELAIRKRAVDAAAQIELAGAAKTQLERKLILAKAEAEKQNLENEFYQKQMQAAKDRAATRKTETEREFQESLKLLEDYLENQRKQAEIANLKGLTSEAEYQDKLSAINKAGLAAEAVVYADYSQETTELSKKVTDDQIKDLMRLRAQKDSDLEKEKVRLQGLYDSTSDATAAIGSAFGELLANQEADAEEFGKTLALLALDALEKIVLAQQAAALVQSLASAESIATFGAAGAIKAAIITGLIQAAFATAKGAITAGFAEGGSVKGIGGPKEDNIKAYGPGDTSAPTYRLSAGEFVLSVADVKSLGGSARVDEIRKTARQNPGQQPILQFLQQPLYNPNKTNFATGGPVGVSGRMFDGGFAQRAIVEASPLINYDQLGRVLAKYIPTKIDYATFPAAKNQYDKPRNDSSINSAGKRW